MRITSTIVIAAVFAVAAACSSSDELPADPSRTFFAALGSDPETFDPGIMSGSIEGKVGYQLYEGLISPPPGDGPPRPGVAERWETSPDGITWTFHLRNDARWSNGDRVVAADFREAWLRMLRGDVAADYVSFVRYIDNAHAFEVANRALKARRETRVLRNLLERQVGVSAPNDETLVVRLEQPTPFFADVAMFYVMFPVHRGNIELHGQEDAFRSENLVTNGPFRMHRYLRRNRVELVVNEHYWDRDNLGLDAVVFPIIEDNSARVTAFLDERVDWMHDPPNNQLVILSAMDEFQSAPQLGTYYYRFNTTIEPLSDRRVRQALSLALNRAELCRCTLDDLYDTPAGFVPPLPGYTGVDKVRYDPAEARRLLAAAGFPNGEGFPELEILYNTSENHKTIAQFVQDQWQNELGINVVLINQEWKVYLDAMDALDYEVARAGWIGDYVDPNTFLELWRTGDGNNRTGFANPEYDRLIGASLAETDTERRLELLTEAEALLMTEMPVMPIYFYSQFHLVRNNIEGWEMNVRNVHLARWMTKTEAP